MNRLVKHSLLNAAAAGGLFFMARWATRQRFRIFAYHGVSDRIDPALNFDGFFVPSEVFECHLRTMTHHYHVLPLSELVRKVRENEVVPSCAAAITFDDGYLNNYTEAAPLLAKYDLPATFFVTTGFVDGTTTPWWWQIRDAGCEIGEAGYVDWCMDVERRLKNMSSSDRRQELAHIVSRDAHPASRIPSFMSWSHLRELAARGHEIGAHTVSHISLGHESPETVAMEVATSLERVKAEAGTVSPVFSYPYGETAHFTDDLAARLKANGCEAGVTTLSGMNQVGDDLFRLRRLNVTGNHVRNGFRALASGLTELVTLS